jgi:methylated-DNA-protein-cysteine methyltransferase-like protein
MADAMWSLAPQETYYDRVYQLVRSVPAGRVVTYGQVAVLLGAPAAARAVGYALHSLPGDTDVPWWRVVNAGGRTSLKGRGASADLQAAMLADEGVPFDDGRIDLATLRWWPDESQDRRES